MEQLPFAPSQNIAHLSQMIDDYFLDLVLIFEILQNSLDFSL